MHTIPQPPERTATAAELADDAARAGRTRLVPCGHCWQRPGLPCTVSGVVAPGDHLARYLRAERRGLITRAELVRVVAALDVIAACVIVPDGTR